MKKQISIIILLLCSTLTLNAQSFKATYTYDANGNRVSASVIYLSLKSAKLDSAQSDSVKLDLNQKISNDRLLDSLDNFNVRVFPNPTQGELLIEITGTSPNEFTKQGNTIKLLNYNGQLIYDINQVTSYNTVDLTPLIKGTYILVLYINGKTKPYKIIKN
jgi:hypothetical protein